MRRILISVSLVLVVALGCAECEKPPAIDLEAERAALLAADKAWFQAYSTSETPAETLANRFEEGARLLAPDMPIVEGREAVHDAFAQLIAMPAFHLTFGPSSGEVGAGANLGHTIGSYEMILAPEGQSIRITGKYLTVWRKDDKGEWMVLADMFNADGPPTPIEEPAAAE